MRAGNNVGVSDWSPCTDFIVNQPAGAGATAPTDGNGAFDRFPAMPVPASASGGGFSPGVIFQWPQVLGVIDYAIEIQQDGLIRGWEPEIPATLACVEGICEYVMTNAALPGTNRWRLSARNEIGQTQWSDWVVFAVSQSDTPVTMALAVPVPGNPQGEGVQPGSDYTWDVVEGATHYAIEIQHNEEIRGYDDMISAANACESNTCRYAKPDAARTGSNRWRVGAYSDAGFSGWSEWQVFMVE